MRRNDIIDAAERVFFSKGFENASMDEVAREAEFSKRTVYLYFNSKDQLHCEVMIRGYRLLIGMIESDLTKNPPNNAIDELRDIFLTFMAFSREHPEYFTAIMEYETDDLADQKGVEDDAEAECYRLGEVMFGYLSSALRKGVEEGTLRSDLDAERTALTLWACTIGIYNTGKKKGDYLRQFHDVEPDEFVSNSFALMMRLIASNTAVRDLQGGVENNGSNTENTANKANMD